MSEKNRRRRTGCLTCRRRRVRCDEARPTCERCNAANVECAGYEQRRQVKARSSQPIPGSASTERSTGDPASSTIQFTDSTSILYPRFRADGLPLIAFPSIPRMDQRAIDRARDLLAYHQFLFRTLTLLSPREHLHFWRDRLCEEAWGTEYIFFTIVALGGVHRAVLMMSTPSNHDTNRGLDSKVIAVKTYTEALQRISERPQPEPSPDVFVGGLVLLAYFECLFGNIPAAIGHTNEAAHYFSRMQSDGSHRWDLSLPAIDTAIGKLRHVCHIVLPLLDTGHTSPVLQTRRLSPDTNTDSPLSDQADSTASFLSQRLQDIAESHPEVQELVCDPLLLFEESVLPSQVSNFLEQLRNCLLDNDHLLSEFETQTFDKPNANCSWSFIDALPIPPRPYAATSSPLCLFAATHSFYMARIFWALSLLGDEHEREKHYLTAYCYLYEHLRATATIISNGEGVNDKGEGYLACETLDIGLLPMLHLLGQCCPRPSWLRWIMEQLIHLRQEGLFNGDVLAKSLNALYTFEMSNNLDSSSMLDRFPPPTSRVISVLLPELDGQSYTAFYASPASRENAQHYPIGHARWTNVRRGGTAKPDIEMYSEQRKLIEPFTRTWVLKQRASQEWMTWSTHASFSLDRALHDHISGSCLENAVYEQNTK